jgi:hypothetical protein
MTDIDPRHAAIDAHMAAESAQDLDATIATVTSGVRYEFPLQGQVFSGRETARRFYADGAEARFRTATRSGRTDLPAGVIRARWTADGAMIVEASEYPVMLADGTAESHPVGAVIVGTPDGVSHERIYVNDRMFELLTAHVKDALEPL